MLLCCSGADSGGAGTLKKLYERIRNQRDNWAQKSTQETTSGDEEEPDASNVVAGYLTSLKCSLCQFVFLLQFSKNFMMCNVI